jgi:hypothetical protein
MAKDLTYYKSKILTLRSAMDDLLGELDKQIASDISTPPRKRQNKKDARVMNFEAFYNNRKLRKSKSA